MLTGAEYIASLDDGRLTYFEGRRVPDLLAEPAFATPARAIASGYDRHYSPDPDATNPLVVAPRSISTLSISCYSFTDVARRAASLMTNGGSMLTLTYGGATRVMPNYNVMGVAKAALEASVRYLAADLGQNNIRVNAISAGPMRTLAGSAVGDARLVFKWNKAHSPLKKNIELDHVGGAALYLLSELSAGVTGEIHFVDAGYHVIGMPPTADLKGWIAPENGEPD